MAAPYQYSIRAWHSFCLDQQLAPEHSSTQVLRIINSYPNCDPHSLTRYKSETDTQLTSIVSSVSEIRFLIKKNFCFAYQNIFSLKLLRKGGAIAFSGNPA